MNQQLMNKTKFRRIESYFLRFPKPATVHEENQKTVLEYFTAYQNVQTDAAFRDLGISFLSM